MDPPWTQAVRAKEDYTVVTLAEGLFDGPLPGIARNEVPFVEPARYTALFKLERKHLYTRLVRAIVGQKRSITLIAWTNADTHGSTL
jgi:hypothetical protein